MAARVGLAAAIIAAMIPQPGAAQAVPLIDVAAARASLAGGWTGKLEYLDYGANKWFGIPLSVQIEDQRDGATIIRKADFDDGPKTGIVRITTVELLDAAKSLVWVGTFRKGQAALLSFYTVRLVGDIPDATHWTMIEETRGMDDNRAATLRLTTVRNGDSLQTLKEVDFLDDDQANWLTRNRTTLTRDAR